MQAMKYLQNHLSASVAEFARGRHCLCQTLSNVFCPGCWPSSCDQLTAPNLREARVDPKALEGGSRAVKQIPKPVLL